MFDMDNVAIRVKMGRFDKTDKDELKGGFVKINKTIKSRPIYIKIWRQCLMECKKINEPSQKYAMLFGLSMILVDADL